MEFSSQSSHLNLDKIIRSRTDRIVSVRIDLFISREELEDEILEGERVRENGGARYVDAHTWHQMERRERSFWEQGV